MLSRNMMARLGYVSINEVREAEQRAEERANYLIEATEKRVSAKHYELAAERTMMSADLNDALIQRERWQKIAEDKNRYIMALEQRAQAEIDVLNAKLDVFKKKLKQRDRFIGKHVKLQPKPMQLH